jgi:hypothetical protein
MLFVFRRLWQANSAGCAQCLPEAGHFVDTQESLTRLLFEQSDGARRISPAESLRSFQPVEEHFQ